MTIVSYKEMLDMIKPLHNEQAQLIRSLNEVAEWQTQTETYLDVYLFNNGAITVTLNLDCEPEFKVLEKDTGSYNEALRNATARVVNVFEVDLDVFAFMGRYNG